MNTDMDQDLSNYTREELIALRDDLLARAASFHAMAAYAGSAKVRNADLACAERCDALALQCCAELTLRNG
jgi:hypothetical protein